MVVDAQVTGSYSAVLDGICLSRKARRFVEIAIQHSSLDIRDVSDVLRTVQAEKADMVTSLLQDELDEDGQSDLQNDVLYLEQIEVEIKELIEAV